MCAPPLPPSTLAPLLLVFRHQRVPMPCTDVHPATSLSRVRAPAITGASVIHAMRGKTRMAIKNGSCNDCPRLYSHFDSRKQGSAGTASLIARLPEEQHDSRSLPQESGTLAVQTGAPHAERPKNGNLWAPGTRALHGSERANSESRPHFKARPESDFVKEQDAGSVKGVRTGITSASSFPGYLDCRQWHAATKRG